MPVEGYKSITVPAEVYRKLSDLAEKTHRTIPKTVEMLVYSHCEEKKPD